jgi:hypothetical protein
MKEGIKMIKVFKNKVDAQVLAYQLEKQGHEYVECNQAFDENGVLPEWIVLWLKKKEEN